MYACTRNDLLSLMIYTLVNIEEVFKDFDLLHLYLLIKIDLFQEYYRI